MPALKNPRHERFAQALAAGKSAKDAYTSAGYSPSDSNGAWLARKEAISNRVAEINSGRLEKQQKIEAAATERAVITRASLIEMARDVYVQAKQSGQMSAATMALKELGVLSGIRIERSERGSPGQFDWLEKLSVNELRQLAAGELDIAQYQSSAERQSIN
jgi:hypothetical protein